jgi:hypothetical protein
VKAVRISGILVVATVLPVAASAQVRSGGYITKRAGVEVTRETYRFDRSTLTAQVEIPPRGLRLDTRTEFSQRLSPSRYHATVRGLSGASTLQEIDATFGDSVHWTLRAGAATRNGSNAISRPYAIFQNLMFSQLAVALLRYDRGGRGTQVVDLWLPEGARVGQLRMKFSGDSGEVEMSGVTLYVKTDPSGWLRSAVVPQQSLTVEWHEELSPVVVSASVVADTMPPPAVRESTVTFVSGSQRLEGTLTFPARPANSMPAVVVVAGSGPTDRNGNAVPSLRSNAYAQLAWRLGERGIASLRYDKRGVGGSRASPLSGPVSLDDLAGDAAAAARLLRSDSRVTRVIIVGHSEGAWLAMRAANTGAPVAGVALLSGIGRGIADVISEQLTTQIDTVAARKFRELFPRYLAGADLGATPGNLQPLLLPANRAFMKSLAAFDAPAELKRVRIPVLIVQGDQDVQVSVRDAQLLKAAKPDAKLVVIPGANHVYKSAMSRDRMVQLALYVDPTVPIVPRLVEELAGWIQSLK